MIENWYKAARRNMKRSETMVQITLHSHTLLCKYVLVYAYETNPDVITNVEYLYNDTLPMFDVHFSSECRKQIMLAVPGVGSYALRYDARQARIQMDVVQNINNLGVVYNANTLEILKEVSLSGAAEDVMLEFVQQAKAYVQAKMMMLAQQVGNITRYVFNTRYKEWDVLNSSPKRSFDTVFINAADKARLCERVAGFLLPETQQAYLTYSVPYKLNVMLHGKPGTGKTSTIHALASMLESNVCVLQFTRELDDLGLTKAVNSMSSMPNARILVLEDIDCLFMDRKEHDTQRNAVTLSGLLNVLDGLMRAEGLLVFMTANDVSILDSALMRPGRVDLVIKYESTMKKQQIYDMFAYYMPHQVDAAFDAFYASIEHKDVTPSILQSWFFHYRHAADVREHIPDLLAWMRSYKKEGRGGSGGIGGGGEGGMYM